jgi:hypothetical protein
VYDRIDELPVVRPSRELFLWILKEKVAKMKDSDPRWAEEALKFGWDELGQRDLWKVMGHLAGRETLLTGEWQEGRRRILAAWEEEQASLAREGG